MNLSNIINFNFFRSEGAEWKKFGRAVLIYFFPFQLALLILLEILAWRVGETVPTSISVRRQIEQPNLIWGTADNRDHVRFKLARLAIDRPEIVIMGTSRMGRFRGAAFRPYSCYNMARLCWNFESLTEILKRFPEDYNPKVIFVGVDYNLFNALPPEIEVTRRPAFTKSTWEYHLQGLRQTALALHKHPALLRYNTVDPYYKHPSSGLQSVVAGYGFRKDGSEQTPGTMISIAGNNRDMLDSFLRNAVHLGRGQELDASELHRFKEFVCMAKARGITVVALQMPIYTPVLRAAENDPRLLNIQSFRRLASSGYFEQLGVIYFDFLEFPPYSNDYRYFQDELHPGEATTIAILQKMMDDPRMQALLPKLNRADLQSWIDKDRRASQHMYFFENED